jgi:cytochrome c-type biogenesis protein CcmF
LPGLLAYTFSAFVIASIVLEFWRGTRATGSLVRLVGRNRRRYGGYLVHAAVVLLAIGIAGSSAYQTVRERGLKTGQSLEVAGYTLTYEGLQTRQESNAVATRAIVDVTRGSSHVATLHPGKNTYPVEKQTSNEVSIYHDPRNLGDLFLIADQIDPSGTLFLKALSKPLVNLIWAAGFLFVFGALVAMWPDAVEQRRLAERYAAAPA